jgi:hypothetical protein
VPAAHLQYLSLAAACATALACTSMARPAAPEPSPAPSPATTPAEPTRWSPRYTAGTWRYELRTDAIIALTADTAARRVPVQSVALYTITLQPAGPQLALSGAVDSMAVVAEGRAAEPQAGRTTRPHFTGVISAQGALTSLQATPAGSCPGGLDPVVANAGELVVSLPATLSAGSVWRDTATMVTCRGQVPLTTTLVREYRVVGPTTWSEAPALQIERRTTTSLEGTGSQGGQTISVSGNGSSTATLYVDRTTAVLLGASGESHSTLTVTTPRASLPFRQDTRDSITLLK